MVATDALDAAQARAEPRQPGAGGGYVLEIRTAWEPVAGPAGTRLGRWVRRRRNPSQATSATRRLTLAVVAPQPPATPPPSKGDGGGVEVDAIDLARSPGIARRPRAGRRWKGRAGGRGPCPRRRWSTPPSATGSGAGSTGPAASLDPGPGRALGPGVGGGGAPRAAPRAARIG